MISSRRCRLFALSALLFGVLFLPTFSSTPYKATYSAVEMGMGGTSLTYRGKHQLFHNQALLSYTEKFSANINFVSRYGLNDLNIGSISFTAPMRNFALGAVYYYSGNTNFHRQMIGVAGGVNLSKRVSVGIQIDYFNEHFDNTPNNLYAVSFELGSAIAITENTIIGLHVFNPLPPTLLESFLPTTAEIGIGSQITSTLFVTAEAAIDTFYKTLEAKAGFDYEIIKNLFLRAGFATENRSFCFGAGYEWKIIALDVALNTHETLGNTFTTSLAINW